MKNRTVVKFIKNLEGISVSINDVNAIDVLIGIAQTIQIIIEETEESKEMILNDINKILEIIEEK